VFPSNTYISWPILRPTKSFKTKSLAVRMRSSVWSHGSRARDAQTLHAMVEDRHQYY
jgi:hypothetical protein